MRFGGILAHQGYGRGKRGQTAEKLLSFEQLAQKLENLH